MGNLSVQLLPNPLRHVDSATLAGVYVPLGNPLENPVCIMKVTNNSNVDVLISFNGQTDHDICPAGGFALYDCAANAVTRGGLYIPRSSQVYINGAAGVGLIYLTTFYPGP